VGIKTQVPSVMNGLSVRENVWLSARAALGPRRADEMADRTLERLGLTALTTTPVGALAHGQRQLVEFGIVLAGDPWLILLDEPTAGMTGEEVERTVALLHELNRTATLIVVEHDMHFIRRIAETVTVFHQGRVLVEADVDAVLGDATVRDVYLGKRR
jgi:branched-chain amino acid transport system ATP-binding protein/urea transport system ATP-binding protein